MKKIILLCLPVAFIACNKSSQEIQKLTEQSLTATWRLDAVRSANDSLNPSAWVAIDYTKQTTSFDVFCVYDAQLSQNFLSKSSCSYDNGFSNVSCAPNGCATSVFRRDTVSQQLMNNDVTFTSSHEFNWKESLHLSKRLFLINQNCSTPIYEPENDITYEAVGQWTLDQSTDVITVDYGTEYSRLDGEQINYFKVKEFTGSTITIKQISTAGMEYRFRKL